MGSPNEIWPRFWKQIFLAFCLHHYWVKLLKIPKLKCARDSRLLLSLLLSSPVSGFVLSDLQLFFSKSKTHLSYSSSLFGIKDRAWIRTRSRRESETKEREGGRIQSQGGKVAKWKKLKNREVKGRRSMFTPQSIELIHGLNR